MLQTVSEAPDYATRLVNLGYFASLCVDKATPCHVFNNLTNGILYAVIILPFVIYCTAFESR